MPTAYTKDFKVENDSNFEKRIGIISAKLDGDNVKAGIGLASSENFFAQCNTEDYENCFLSIRAVVLSMFFPLKI